MNILIRGASEHNLQGIDVEFGDNLTVVTGVSGSGKTSLVFDTLYHEARRRYLEIFSLGSAGLRLSPSAVRSISGLGPAVAVGQNLLNRNPLSTLATASGLHPLLRLLYANFGERHCPRCGSGVVLLTEDEIVERLSAIVKQSPATIFAPLVRGVRGSHRTLLELLASEFGAISLLVDGHPWRTQELNPTKDHDIDVEIARLSGTVSTGHIREVVQTIMALGTHAVNIRSGNQELTLSHAPVCTKCGIWFDDLEPVHFHTPCSQCKGDGCERCDHTGLYPQAAAVRWHGLQLPNLLEHTVDDVRTHFSEADFPSTATRVQVEITRRLEALHRVGLGYITLDRPSPTLSRGEAQRVRLAVVLTRGQAHSDYQQGSNITQPSLGNEINPGIPDQLQH